AGAQQQARIRRIGMLLGIAEHDPEAQVRLGAMLDELQRLGWTSAKLDLVYRWSGDDAERVRAYAEELVSLAPDLIVALSPPVLAAVLARTRTIPIVFVQVSDPVGGVQVSDPVGGGLVESLSHTGGNDTGFTGFQETVSGKWLELLKEAVPSVRRVAVIRNSAKASSSEYLMGTLRSVAPAMGVELIVAPLSAGVHEGAEGLVVMPDPITLVNRRLIVDLASRHSLPAVYPFRYFDHGLISYGPVPADIWRRAAAYVDRILNGAKPSELPVQHPTKFELVINVKTAKELGLTIPPTLLARADEVIE
ncbi:MAG: transporter substrate binding protein, partial [Thermomicrobiales bacterium]|nr:transporter substrate binding protein [Thermomicrobiales bacterium]